MEETIRCLAVRQPWAWALVAGGKDVENRSWSTEHRGTVAILASATKTEVNKVRKSGDLPELGSPFSAIVGVVDLADVVPLNQELEANPWAWGPQCWRFTNPRRFIEPIPSKGRLNLFTLDAALTGRVRRAMETAVPPALDDHADRWGAAMTALESADERQHGLLEAYCHLGNDEGVVRLSDALRDLLALGLFAFEKASEETSDSGRVAGPAKPGRAPDENSSRISSSYPRGV
jgi:ASCH domain